MNKIRQYISVFELTRGFLIALLSSAFIYLTYWGFSYPFLNTILAVTALYLLLQEGKRIWFFSGLFISFLWFWWILVSFKHYEMLWAIPVGLLVISLSYGIVFWLIAFIAEKITSLFTTDYLLFTLIVKLFGLLTLSFIHPFGFDWFKPELIFIESYLGIEKWQFFIILSAIVLSIWKKQLLYLFLILLAYQSANTTTSSLENNIQIVTTHTPVKQKWDKSLHPAQFDLLFKTIDQAIEAKKTLVILPESVFPVFLNRAQKLLDKLKEKSEDISIVTGGLYWDGQTPRNSTYIFTKGHIQVANKVVLVPFGESNPLPDFLSDWVNKVFYDGAVDYKASKEVIDYKIGENTYRNAICFEATSEKLYEGKPKNMIVLSNNGWFIPSIEPTLQRLLLQYYSQKYGTTIYHAVNMAESYIIKSGKLHIFRDSILSK